MPETEEKSTTEDLLWKQYSRINTTIRYASYLLLFGMLGVVWRVQGLFAAGALLGFGIAAYATGWSDGLRHAQEHIRDLRKTIERTIELALAQRGELAPEEAQDHA